MSMLQVQFRNHHRSIAGQGKIVLHLVSTRQGGLATIPAALADLMAEKGSRQKPPALAVMVASKHLLSIGPSTPLVALQYNQSKTDFICTSNKKTDSSFHIDTVILCTSSQHLQTDSVERIYVYPLTTRWIGIQVRLFSRADDVIQPILVNGSREVPQKRRNPHSEILII